jgi:dolichyl-diphosphooligosaccharide--protein glycosyltransferase
VKRSRFHPGLIVGIIVALFFGIALYLRVVHSYDQVFVGDWIKFTGVDAYYHMRLVDSLFHHFPQAITFDPYTFYPYGVNVPWPPFLEWLIIATAWLIGLGSPTQHTVDVLGVSFPFQP